MKKSHKTYKITNEEIIMAYHKRIIDDVIDYYSSMVGCIYIKGPKWVGKTTTALQHSKTVYRLGMKRSLDAFSLAFDADPDLIFSKEKPILFDEWQEAPYLWDEIRNQIDINGGEGRQFFLTGSSELDPKKREEYINHSGTGRFFDIVMRPMSLFESGESNGSISLSSLFDNDCNISGKDSTLSLQSLIYATCRGGWPKSIDEPHEDKALKYASLIVDRILQGDGEGEEEDEIKERFSPKIMSRILKSYARNNCTLASHSSIFTGAKGQELPSLDRKTYDSYIRKLEKLYLLEEVESWCPAFKSRSNLMTSNKKCFVDPSLPISILNLSPSKLANDLIDYGFFFENLCIRDLRIYASKARGKLFYYHDRSGNEVDAVVVLDDGRYALIECKLGFYSATSGANGLLKVKEMIEKHNAQITDKSSYMDLPSALIVLHSGKEALTLKEGVHLVPIGSLRD